jgi:hypothetical protein
MTRYGGGMATFDDGMGPIFDGKMTTFDVNAKTAAFERGVEYDRRFKGNGAT